MARTMAADKSEARRAADAQQLLNVVLAWALILIISHASLLTHTSHKHTQQLPNGLLLLFCCCCCCFGGEPGTQRL